MPERAQVTSLEALEAFRAKLILYRSKARSALDETTDLVTRTRLWLETDRPTYWQNHIRRLERELERARQELLSAQLSGLRDASLHQQMAVKKLRQTIATAEGKRRAVAQWQRHYDTRVETPARQVEKLRHFLDHDLDKALAFLNEALRHLAAYAELAPPTPRTTAPGEPAAPPPRPPESSHP